MSSKRGFDVFGMVSYDKRMMMVIERMSVCSGGGRSDVCDIDAFLVEVGVCV